MQHLDEGTIHAWLDGQLPPDEAESVEAHVAECRPCAGAVAEARGLIAASSRILVALDGVPRDVVAKQAPSEGGEIREPVMAPSITKPSAAERAQRRWLSGASLAAAAVVVVAIGTVVIMRAGVRDNVVLLPTVSATTSGPSFDSAASAVPLAGRSPAAPPAAGKPNAAGARTSPREAATGQTNAPAATARANEVRRDAIDEFRARAEAAPKRFAAADTSGALERAQVRQQIAGAEPQKMAEQQLLKDSKKQELDQNVQVIRGRPVATGIAQRSSDTARQAADVAAAAAMTGGVRGRVTDGNNTGLSSTSVHVIGTNTGMMTNEAGEFALGGLASGRYQVVVRRVGYEAATRDVTITAGQAATLNVVLSPTRTSLSEVVVTAAGAAQRRDGAKTAAAPVPAAAPAAPARETPPPALSVPESNAIGCYELGITAATTTRSGFRQVPRRMALDSVVVPANADGGIWYRARDLAPTNALPNGRWRPSGPGAVEVEWTSGSRVARVILSGLGQAMLRGTVEDIDRATASGEGGTAVATRRPCG